MDSTDSFVLVDQPPRDQLALLDRFFPSNFAQIQPLLQHVERQRQLAPDGKLFVDELLALAGLEGPSVYPPTSSQDLQSLLSHILMSPSLSSLNASSLLYYLALSTSPTTAPLLAESRLLPPEFSLSIRAFHALDSANYPLAIRLLSDPRIRQPDFVAKTIHLLATAPENARDASRFVVAYWRLTGLALNKEEGKIGVEEAKIVVRALCLTEKKRGVSEAWDLAKRWGDESEIEALLRAILAACFGDNSTRTPVSQHLRTLLAYPFSPPEMTLLCSFCLSPPSSLPTPSKTLAVDWFLSLLIASSKPLDALVFWTKVGHKGEVERNEERERLLKAVESTLTTSQRTTLSIEVAALTKSSSRPSNNISTTSNLTTQTLTQPAWVPTPSSTTALSTPPAPPRTLAAARKAALPPPASPAPTPSELPFSASPFVRSKEGGGQGVLRAVQEQQRQQQVQIDRHASLASPARGSGSTPKRNLFIPPPPSSTNAGGSSIAGSRIGVSEQLRGGSPFSFVSTARSEYGREGEGITPVKPTLAGFGSIRQTSTSTPLRSNNTFDVEMDQGGEDYQEGEEEDDDEDEVMLVSAPAPQAQGTEPTTGKKNDEDDFSRRIAFDPAIRKTLLAASKPSTSQPTPRKTDSTKKTKNVDKERDGEEDVATPKRSRVSNGQQQRERASQRGDKRRAVSTEPSQANQDAEKSKSTARDRPDQNKTVKLPPGAFPGMEDERVEEGGGDREEQPEMRQVGRGGGARSTRSTRAGSATPVTSRRSSRARSVAAEEDQERESNSTTTTPNRRRSSRASSVQPIPEMSEVKKAPGSVRRSSRLSTSTTPAKEKSAPKTRRSTRRGQRAIEEEEEGDEEEDDE